MAMLASRKLVRIILLFKAQPCPVTCACTESEEDFVTACGLAFMNVEVYKDQLAVRYLCYLQY
jgi:hypothetical protein